MLLGFKRQFAEYVWEGSKTHTIRAFGKRRPFVPGDRADCYCDVRQKGEFLLGRWAVQRVENIFIDISGGDTPLVRLNVRLDGVQLDPNETDLFAWRDGFRRDPGCTLLGAAGSAQMMIEFWQKTHSLPFRGQVIHWHYEARLRNAAAAAVFAQWRKAA
ncbi:MAG: ASCH domain-containing protein [Bryobacteraceae bacterium]